MKWINNNPPVHYPWQPDSVLQYFHHELDTDLDPKTKILLMKYVSKYVPFYVEMFTWLFSVGRTNTTDNKGGALF